jgi:hypothetical protein
VDGGIPDTPHVPPKNYMYYYYVYPASPGKASWRKLPKKEIAVFEFDWGNRYIVR